MHAILGCMHACMRADNHCYIIRLNISLEESTFDLPLIFTLKVVQPKPDLLEYISQSRVARPIFFFIYRSYWVEQIWAVWPHKTIIIIVILHGQTEN